MSDGLPDISESDFLAALATVGNYHRALMTKIDYVAGIVLPSERQRGEDETGEEVDEFRVLDEIASTHLQLETRIQELLNQLKEQTSAPAPKKDEGESLFSQLSDRIGWMAHCALPEGHKYRGGKGSDYAQIEAVVGEVAALRKKNADLQAEIYRSVASYQEARQEAQHAYHQTSKVQESYHRLVSFLKPESVEVYIKGLGMGSLTDSEKTYVAGNIRGFASSILQAIGEE